MSASDLDANKDIVRAFVAAWNDRDFDRFEALMDTRAVLTIGGTKVPCDPKGTRAIAEEWTTAFPDWRFELLGVVAEGDRVVAHMPYSGTFSRSVNGVAPTGRFANVDEMVIFRIADGKIAEAWEVYDEAGMWRQLGVATPQARLVISRGCSERACPVPHEPMPARRRVAVIGHFSATAPPAFGRTKAREGSDR